MALGKVAGRIFGGLLSIITELTTFILMLVRADGKALPDLVAGTVARPDPDQVLPR
jgi:hypothetical protein